MPLLDSVELDALQRAISDKLVASALKKFFRNQESDYTEKSRNSLNAVPQNLHEKMRNDLLARQYAAFAKAYGTAYAELEKLAQG